jgi:hypothetical protein
LHQHFFSTSFLGLLRRVYFYNYHTYFFEHSLQVSKESVVTLQQSRPARPAPPILPRPPHPTPPLRPTALQPWSEPMKVRKLTLTFLCCPPPPAPSPTPHPRKRRRGGVECGFLSFSCYPPSWKTPKTRKEKEKRRGGGGEEGRKVVVGGKKRKENIKPLLGLFRLFLFSSSLPPSHPSGYVRASVGVAIVITIRRFRVRLLSSGSFWSRNAFGLRLLLPVIVLFQKLDELTIVIPNRVLYVPCSALRLQKLVCAVALFPYANGVVQL